jgi:hypothetical protein
VGDARFPNLTRDASGRCGTCRREYQRERDLVGDSTERGLWRPLAEAPSGVFARKSDLSLLPCPGDDPRHAMPKVHRGTDAITNLVSACPRPQLKP